MTNNREPDRYVWHFTPKLAFDAHTRMLVDFALAGTTEQTQLELFANERLAAKKSQRIPQSWLRDVLTCGVPESLISAAEQTEMRNAAATWTPKQLGSLATEDSGDGNNSSPRRVS